MAVPKKRTTRAKRNMRRSHHAVKRQQLSLCPKCGQAVPRHMVCLNCGTYRERQIIDVLKKLNKKERKAKEKELAEQSEPNAA